MRIIIMAQHYAPEEVSGAVLSTELATDLVKKGHTVTFVTCAPNYPLGKVFKGYQNRLVFKECLGRVQVVRTWSYISPHKTFGKRMLNYGTFSMTAFLGGLIAGRPDVILSYSPPLPLGLSAWLLSRLWRVPWILRVEDLYPDAAVAAGVLQNQTSIRFFFAMERFLYSRAAHISLISEGFRQNLLRKGVPAKLCTVIPIWADPEEVYPLHKENCFRSQHRLVGKFVVLYAGNLGHNSALEELVDAAEILSGEEDIRFVIVGEGVKKTVLQNQAQEKGLSNILFLPFQPRSLLPEMMAAADLGVVTLNLNLSHTSLPYKTFNIMSSGRPILAITPESSEIAGLVQDTGCGVNVAPGQPERLAQLIRELKSAPEWLDAMGKSGRVQVETAYSRQRCVGLFEETLRQVAG